MYYTCDCAYNEELHNDEDGPCVLVSPCKFHSPVTTTEADTSFHHFPRIHTEFTNRRDILKKPIKKLDQLAASQLSGGNMVFARQISSSTNNIRKPSCVIDGVPKPMFLSTTNSALQNSPIYGSITGQDMDHIVNSIPITPDCNVAEIHPGDGLVVPSEPNLRCPIQDDDADLPDLTSFVGDNVTHTKSRYTSGQARATLFVVTHDTTIKALQAIKAFNRHRNFNIACSNSERRISILLHAGISVMTSNLLAYYNRHRRDRPHNVLLINMSKFRVLGSPFGGVYHTRFDLATSLSLLFRPPDFKTVPFTLLQLTYLQMIEDYGLSSIDTFEIGLRTHEKELLLQHFEIITGCE